MLLVVDVKNQRFLSTSKTKGFLSVNVIYSALMQKGNSLKVFELNRLFREFEFIAPEFMATELNTKIGKILLKSKLRLDDLNDVLLLIKEQITFVPVSEFIDKLSEAVEINAKDAPYIALALKLNCPIFSGDKGLKEQTKVEVFSPRDLLDLLGYE